MYDTCAVEGTHLTVDAAFLRHTTSKVEEKRKRLYCIAEKRGLYCNIQYKQTHHWHKKSNIHQNEQDMFIAHVQCTKHHALYKKLVKSSL